MNLIGSLDMPTKVTIYLDKIDISKLGESDLAQIRGKKIGFIFQSFNLVPNLTAKGNVMLPMIFQEIDEFERAEIAEDLLEKVGLGDRMDHYPDQLSGGQKQRVAIARALANDPEVILADEPTGNLDSKTGNEIVKLLDKLHGKEKKTIILVTHNSEQIKNAGRICYLKDGQIIRETKRGKTFKR